MQRVSSVLASSQQGGFCQDPLKQDVSRGGPMDGFIAVSWKKTPGCGLARPQVVQHDVSRSGPGTGLC
jgi:hypothetical protein